MKNSLKKIIVYSIALFVLFVLGLFAFIAYKTAPIKDSRVSNPKKVCEEVYKAHQTDDFKKVIALLKRELDVSEEDIRIGREGIEVRLDGFFTTDVGLYFSYNPTGINNNSFYRYTFFEECIGGYVRD